MAKQTDTKTEEALDLGILGLKKGTNILKVDVPPELEERVETGIGWVDDVFGGGEGERGLTPSTSILFTGTPGAGKTTLALQIANSWTQQGNICVYNTNEESALQVRKTTKRLGMSSGFIIGEDRLVPNLIEHCNWLREKNPGKKLLIIGDSIQTHDDGFYKDGGTNSMTPVRVTKRLTSYCKQTFSLCMLIGQVNKDGKFNGKQTIKHDVDVHAHLLIDQKPSSPSFGKRIFKIEKNRFGFSQVGYFLGLDGKKGLYEDAAWSPEVEME